MAILLLWFSNNYNYSDVIYTGLASFDLQRHKLVEFREKKFWFCHLSVFQRRSR